MFRRAILYAAVTAVSADVVHTVHDQQTFNILIAGFGPFTGDNGTTYTTNPSAETALALDNHCYPMNTLLPSTAANSTSRVCFLGWNVTVDHRGAAEVQNALRRESIQRAGIDAIIHLGLENSAVGLKIETAGANIMAEPQFEGEKIEPWAQAISPTTIDFGRLHIIDEALAPVVAAENRYATAAGIATKKTVGEAWSRDAGTFYCNEALFRTATTVRELSIFAPNSADRLLPAVFVHLPNSTVAPVDEVLVPSIASLGAAILVDQPGY